MLKDAEEETPLKQLVCWVVQGEKIRQLVCVLQSSFTTNVGCQKYSQFSDDSISTCFGKSARTEIYKIYPPELNPPVGLTEQTVVFVFCLLTATEFINLF